jgi:hypothetical protein
LNLILKFLTEQNIKKTFAGFGMVTFKSFYVEVFETVLSLVQTKRNITFPTLHSAVTFDTQFAS